MNGSRNHEPDEIRKQRGMELYKCKTTSETIQLLHHVLTGAMQKDIPNI